MVTRPGRSASRPFHWASGLIRFVGHRACRPVSCSSRHQGLSPGSSGLTRVRRAVIPVDLRPLSAVSVGLNVVDRKPRAFGARPRRIRGRIPHRTSGSGRRSPFIGRRGACGPRQRGPEARRARRVPQVCALAKVSTYRFLPTFSMSSDHEKAIIVHTT